MWPLPSSIRNIARMSRTDIEKKRLVKAVACALILNLIFIHLAFGQAPDFLHPQQKGPFTINGLSFVEWDSYTDPVTFTSPVATIDQIVQEIKATNTNLVKIT